MPTEGHAETWTRSNAESAYLRVRDGNSWQELHRLLPEQVTTIGRAATNRLVLRDEICSRHHCEVFFDGRDWIIRDLDSRNGTFVGRRQISEDTSLADGDHLKLGASELFFTLDPDASVPADAGPSEGSRSERETHAPSDQDEDAPAILLRQRETRFTALTPPDIQLRERLGQDLATLYRLALQMGSAASVQSLCDGVLDVLLGNTGADVGAIFTLKPEFAHLEATQVDQLQILSFSGQQSDAQHTSQSLSRMVLDGGEAVLGTNVPQDGRLAARDSLGRIRARSVLCTPVRSAGKVLGLIHLYALDPDQPLGPDDLEFTLAVSDQLGLVLAKMNEHNALAADLNRVHLENENLRQQLRVSTEIVGRSPVVETLRKEMAKVSPTRATVLIRGESGVGKELVARAIHNGSSRSDGPFVCLNCAALSESLLESELFGHEKGSFTGATGRKIGKFEAADGGTLFLDEVGEMSLTVQAKFLRVLEGHAFERVGGNQSIKTDVRVVAATNRDLEEAVEQGEFRRDLYFRLHVVVLHVEPLRNRPGDIELLANHFRERIGSQTGRPVRAFHPEALQRLRSYDWPGNVRELQNTIERAIILSSGDVIRSEDIRLTHLGAPETPTSPVPPTAEYREIPLGILEREHILATLAHTDGNKTRAAQILGIERSTLDRKLKRYQ